MTNQIDKRLYDPKWWEQTIDKGIPLSFRFEDLPVEELLILDEFSREYPGLRFNLRKQRGQRFLLTILPSRHLTDNEAKGEP